jgi:hypothetical protein
VRRRALLVAAAVAIAAPACGSVEWQAPEHFDDWITSNRYLEATRTAVGGMSVTVVALFGVAIAVAFAGRGADGPSLLDGPGSMWAFRTTAAVVAVTAIGWLVAMFS